MTFGSDVFTGDGQVPVLISRDYIRLMSATVTGVMPAFCISRSYQRREIVLRSLSILLMSNLLSAVATSPFHGQASAIDAAADAQHGQFMAGAQHAFFCGQGTSHGQGR